MKKYDYIIAGAGCAGLSLAYHLNQTALRNKSILLIDKVGKDQNDRTWCFWEMKNNPFERLVCRQWTSIHFYSKQFHSLLTLAPYRYKMIRSVDFYQFVKADLQQNMNIEWAYENIVSIEEFGNGAQVTTDQAIYSAYWVFDSTYQPPLNLPQYHNLLQHFKGWEIETDAPVFDPESATLMDFRIKQQNEARFFYVLPFNARRALVEFTVFSASLLSPLAYEAALNSYLKEFYQLDSYHIVHEEFGVIPMTDAKLTDHPSKHIVRIGTSGGYTKPSTGYTFLRIQERTQALVNALLHTAEPFTVPQAFQSRFALYDSVLLNVLQKNRCEAQAVFASLFQKNPASTVFQFLDEQTNLLQELEIVLSVPSMPFLTALTDVLYKKVTEWVKQKGAK
ncbi:MAG: lycopene cyclase family protein [Bacteroidota bacterium]